MSRNVDKANSVLVRYQELQAEEGSGYKDYSRYKRPTKLSSVKSLNEAQQWRKQITREINDKITRIYDPSLNEIQVQELNDELNELLTEQNKWDWYMSKVLGGKRPDKRRRDDMVGGKLINGKRYFGRALELPEVKDILKKQQDDEIYGKNGKGIVNTKLIPKDKSAPYYGAEKMVSEELIEFEEQWTSILRKKIKGNDRLSGEKLENIDTKIPTIQDMESWLVEERKKKLLKDLSL